MSGWRRSEERGARSEEEEEEEEGEGLWRWGDLSAVHLLCSSIITT